MKRSALFSLLGHHVSQELFPVDDDSVRQHRPDRLAVLHSDPAPIAQGTRRKARSVCSALSQGITLLSFKGLIDGLNKLVRVFQGVVFAEPVGIGAGIADPMTLNRRFHRPGWENE